MNEEMTELIENFMDKENIRYEGERGIDGLNKLAKKLGYKDSNYQYGSSFEQFIQDNAGAVEAIYNWMMEQNCPEWKEKLKKYASDEESDEEDE